MVVLDSRGRLVPPDHAALAVRLAATVRRASGAPVAPMGPRVAPAPPVPSALKVLQASRAHPARVARLVPPVVDRLVPLARRELLVCLVKWVGRVPQAPWEALVSRVPAASRAPRVCVAPQAKPSVVPWAPVARAVAPVRKVLRAPLALWASRALWVVLVTRVPRVYLGAWVAMGRWVCLVVRVSLVLSVCVEALVARVYPARVALRALAVRVAYAGALAALDPRVFPVLVVCRDLPVVPVCRVCVDPLASWVKLALVAPSALLRRV